MRCFRLHGRAGLASLDSDLPFLEELGLAPEVFLPAKALDSLDAKMISSLVRWKEAGRDFTFHAPFVDLSPGGLDPRVLEVTRYRFGQVMDLAEKVAPRQVLFHPGFDGWRFAFRENLWVENSVGLWSELMDRAGRSGFRILLENVFDARPDHLSVLRERLGKGLGFCLDTGHLNLFSEVPLEEWITAFGDGLIELHLHDNNGSRDQHLPVNEGTFDFTALFREIRSRDRETVTVLENHSREETRRSLATMERLSAEGLIYGDPSP